MKKVLTILLLAAVAVFAISTDDLYKIGFNKLSESQKADFVKQVEEATTTSQTTTPQKLDEWADVGFKIGRAVGSAARELGMAVNEFIVTPAGKLTVALVIWKVFGVDVVHIITGIVALVVFLFLAHHMRLAFAPETREYDTDKVDIFKRSRLKKTASCTMSGEEMFGYWLTVAVGFIIAAVLWCTI